MAKHVTPLDAKLQAAAMRENAEHRFSYLYRNDCYNGQYAGEFEVLESFLREDSLVLEGNQFSGDFAKSEVDEDGGGGEGRSGDRRCDTVLPPFPSPQLLTGG